MDDTHRTPNDKHQPDADADPHQRPRPRTRPRPRRLWHAGAASTNPGDAVDLEPEEARHAMKALRMREGEAVELIDGRGTVAAGVLTRARAPRATVRIDVKHAHPEPRPSRTVLAAPPKGARLESMAGMLVQLGVRRLVLLDTERSVTEPGAAKMQRLERVVIEACKQCGRTWAMAVQGPIRCDTALDHGASEATVRLLATATGDPRHDLPAAVPSAAEVRVLVGPEGGFTPEEEHAAHAAGYQPWALGASVLRIETAATAAAAVLAWAAQKPDPPGSRG